MPDELPNRILIIGDETSRVRAGLSERDGAIEVVGSLKDAIGLDLSAYARIIVDPAASSGPKVELMAPLSAPSTGALAADPVSRLSRIVEQAPVGACVFRGRDFVYELANRAYREMAPAADILGKKLADVWPEAAETLAAAIERAIDTGEAYSIKDQPLRIRRSAGGPLETGYFDIYFKRGSDDAAGQPGVLHFVFETTERVRTVQEAAASASQLRSVLENSPCVNFRQNVSTGRYEYVSSASEKILGYSVETFRQMDRDTVLSLIHPDDLPLFLAAQEELEKSDTVKVEYRQRRRDGGYRWLLSTLFIERDSFGKPIYRTGALTDVSDLKQAEAALRESEQHLRLFVQHAPVALALFDTEMRYLAVSRRWMTDYGLGRNITGLCHYDVFPDMPAHWKEAHRRGLSGETVQEDEDLFERADGSRQWLRWELLPWRSASGAVGGIVVMTEDVTRRRQVEEELSEARARAEQHASELASFFSSMTDGVVLHDASGNSVLTNEAAAEILGNDRVGPFSERVDRFTVRHVDDTPMTLDDTASARALRGEIVRDMRYKLRAIDGQDKVISISASPVRSAGGAIVGATTVFADITREWEFERLRDDLYRREHHIAQVLQQAVIPGEIPAETLGYRIAATHRPALKEAEIGGDFYDIFELEGDRLAVVIGDVTGKGLNAALRVCSARHFIRGYSYVDAWPERVLALTNEALCRDHGVEADMLTVFLAILDPLKGQMAFASAGHQPALIFRAGGQQEELKAFGLPLGLMAGGEYQQGVCKLDPMDLAVMVTDGITEARKLGPVLFESEGVVRFVQNNRDLSPHDLVNGILDAATAHAGGHLQDDGAVVAFTPLAGKAQGEWLTRRK